MLSLSDDPAERKWGPCSRCCCCCNWSITFVYLLFSIIFVTLFVGSSIFLLLTLLDDTEDTDSMYSIPKNFDAATYWIELVGSLLPLGSVLIPGQAEYKALQWMVMHDPLRPVVSPIRARQRFSVAVLYFSWSGPTWKLPTQSGWLKEASENIDYADECSWKGIVCNQDDEVTELNLENEVFGVFGGTLPRHIGDLTALESLVLPGHELRGSTVFLDKLSNLQTINLAINRLTDFDLESKPLTNLRELILSENRIKGVWDIGVLKEATQLRVLEVNRNLDLRGNILDGLSDLSNLESINVAFTSLQGLLPEDIGRLTNLQSLVLGGDSLTPLPKSLGDCTNLGSLRVVPHPTIDGTGLEGGLITELGRLTNLRFLDVTQNSNLGSTIPTELGLLTNMIDLKLMASGLEGTLPTQLGNIGASLTNLSVAENNGITGTVPTEFGRLSNLADLSFVGTQLSGTMPEEVCNIGIGSSIKASCLEGFSPGLSEVLSAISTRISCSCCDCIA